MKRKIVSIIAIAILLFGISAISASAETVASGTCGDNVTWTLDTEGTLTISGTGAMENYDKESDIPWNSWDLHIKTVIIESGVSTIGDRAFYCCENLASITIPDSVTSIGDRAFFRCFRSLTSITIPCSVTYIGEGVFVYCSSLTEIVVSADNPAYSSDSTGVLFDKNKRTLICHPAGSSNTNYTIPDSVTTICDSAFYCCEDLTSISIPDGVKSIGGEAFLGCYGLTSITIPDSVTTIGYAAFLGCYGLVNIEVASNNPAYLSDSTGVLFDKNKTTLICYPAESSNTNYTIPDSVTAIDEGAFLGCGNLTSITIPDRVTTIGVMTFYGCTSLTSISIPNSVTTIGDSAFRSCYSLTSISIPDSVISIGDEAFGWCYSLTSIDIPDSVTTIGNSAFYCCEDLTSISIPNSVTIIGNSAFGHCYSLTSISIPNSVISIGDEAFVCCYNLTEIVVSADNPAYSSDSTGVLFNKNKTTLICHPAGSSNTNYIISDSVTTIGDYAFYCCEDLTSISIPDSVTTIGNSAFSRYDNLSCVEYEGNEVDWGNIDMGSDNYDLTSAAINYNSPIFGKNAMDNKISVTKTEDDENWLFAIKLDKQTLDTDYAYVGIYNEYGNMITYARAELSSEGTANISIAKKLGADYAKVFVWRNVTPLAFFEKIDL